MSKQVATYGQLSSILSDIERQTKNSPAFEIFNREKIKRFTQQNSLRINLYYEKRKKIFEDNIHIDENGNLKLKQLTDEEVKTQTQPEYDFISLEHKIAFEEKSKEFLSTTFEMFL